MPLSGTVCRPYNLATKFEVSVLTHYEDTKKTQNVEVIVRPLSTAVFSTVGLYT